MIAIQPIYWRVGRIYRKHSFLYCCVLDRVYRAVAWQLVDQIRYNINKLWIFYQGDITAKGGYVPRVEEAAFKERQVQHKTGIVNETAMLECDRKETTLQCGQVWRHVASPRNHTCVQDTICTFSAVSVQTGVRLVAHTSTCEYSAVSYIWGDVSARSMDSVVQCSNASRPAITQHRFQLIWS
jgi:hypothetical protein